jgi:putative tricarboxylic transport membrane protein
MVPRKIGQADCRNSFFPGSSRPMRRFSTLLYPAILLFCCVGVYSINNNAYDVLFMALFALLGYVCIKLECEPAPLILGFILGPLMEENLRRAMLLSRGDPTTFVTKPISATLLGFAVLLLLVAVAPTVRRTLAEAFQEG